MPYLNLDDEFTEHPKIDALSDGAFRLHVEAMSRADGCPECGDNYEPPKRATLTPDLSAYSCAYRCTSCGHTWETSWAPGSIEWML